jgi:hypothetical protein
MYVLPIEKHESELQDCTRHTFVLSIAFIVGGGICNQDLVHVHPSSYYIC